MALPQESRIRGNKKMTRLTDLESATYINIESYRQTGAGVPTPVWQTAENKRLYVWTQADSGKVKRIRRNENVRVCACTARGTPTSEWVAAKAVISDSADDEALQQRRMIAKYGLAFRAFWLMGKLRRTRYVVIMLSEQEQ